METEPVRIDKNVMNRLRMYIAQRTAGRVYGEIGATIGKAITEYLYREENCHKIFLTKEMDYFNRYVTVESENVFGRVVMLHPIVKGNPYEKEDMILIRAADNEIRLTLRDTDKEIENKTVVRLVIEDKVTGNHQEPVGNYFYEELKSKITIKKEVRIPIHRALSIYVPNYAGKKIYAENIRFNIDLCPGTAKV